MGTDYFRFRLKTNADRGVLDSLIKRQSVAYQSIWGWQLFADFESTLVSSALMEQIHIKEYLLASNQLKNLLHFPIWDEKKGARPIFRICQHPGVYINSRYFLFSLHCGECRPIERCFPMN